MTYLLFIIKSALFDFSRNKVRTLLTSLGILIGVSSVILLLAFGVGLRVYISDQFQSLGSNLLYVMPGNFGKGSTSFRPGALGGIRFDERDLTTLRKIKEAKAIVGVFAKTLTVSANAESETTDIFATTPEIFSVRNFEIDTGRLFDKTDVDKRAKITVIGPKIAEKLFTTSDQALGKTIKTEGSAYKVIGVLKGKGGGGFGGPDFDSFVYVPYTSATQFNPDKIFVSFYIQASSENDIAYLKDRITQVLSKRYKTDEFSAVEQTEILSTITSIFGVINSILVAIGAISLIVGGVGIMNIMYVSVTERIKEIGIRRAVGARRRDILYQFLTESVILSLIGGISGLALSAVIVLVIRKFFPATIEPIAVIAAVGVSSIVGVLFGVFPAKKASDLSPIDAIRYE
jgi:putative ABC transport system permease protein